jgi:hypothetical protein
VNDSGALALLPIGVSCCDPAQLAAALFWSSMTMNPT